MKKIFEYLGLISLICFSFFITEKTTVVVQEVDEIMIQIKNENEMYNLTGVNADIVDNTIIPGLVDKIVNVKKSYTNMKEKGIYDPVFYIYDFKKPEVSINDHIDKYIVSGNSKKNMVSLVFLIENKQLETIQNTIGTTKVTYILESYNIDSQINGLSLVRKMNNDIIVATSNKESYELLKTKLKSIDMDLKYCYNPTKSNEFLKICSDDNIHSITTDHIIESNPLSEVKKNLKSGSILVFKINNQTIKELPNIISYIKSRGYEITTLSNHLSENW